MADNFIELAIRNMAGDDITICRCQASDTVLALRRSVGAKMHMPIRLFKLSMQGGCILDDTATLQDNELTSGQHLTLTHLTGANLQSLPQFCGLYRGEESEEGIGGRAIYELCVDSVEFSEGESALAAEEVSVQGVFHWRCVLNEAQPERQNTLAKEFVRGSLNTKTHHLMVSGYGVEYFGDCPGIAMATYHMQFSLDGSHIACTYEDLPHVAIDEPFILERCVEEETLRARIANESDAISTAEGARTIGRDDYFVSVHEVHGLAPQPDDASFYFVSIAWHGCCEGRNNSTNDEQRVDQHGDVVQWHRDPTSGLKLEQHKAPPDMIMVVSLHVRAESFQEAKVIAHSEVDVQVAVNLHYWSLHELNPATDSDGWLGGNAAVVLCVRQMN